MHVTVCVCTRDRGDSITDTLESFLALDYDDYDVVIVDQSAAGGTAKAVRSVDAARGKLTYIRSSTTGLSAARNVAIAQACGQIIALTDDDCEVPADWLTRIVRHFRANPDVGQLCGEVRAAPHDPSVGFIPTFGVSRRRKISSPWLKWREGGIGANMAFREETLRAVGPFDELLGAGGALYSSEDRDITYRVLRAGYAVLDVSDVYVVHSGFRPWGEGRSLMHRAGLSMGAVYMKHLRLGDVAVLPTLVYEWWTSISWRRLLLFRPRTGVGRFLWYLRGLHASFRYDIDRRWRVYVPIARRARAELSLIHI